MGHGQYMTTTRMKRLDERRAHTDAPQQPILATLAAPGRDAGFTAWHTDPVARCYLAVEPSAREKLKHPTFTDALLYRGANGGAVVLQTHDQRVLAMDYNDPDELEFQWRETLLFYAGIL